MNTTKPSIDDTRVLIIDCAAGIYIPRNFYENFDLSSWGLNVSDYADLSDPSKEHYWDAWDDVLSNAVNHDNDGHTWTLEHDDSLFAIRDDHDYESDDT